jgi:hypothetical protein
MYERPETCTTYPVSAKAEAGSPLPAYATIPAHRDAGSVSLTSKHSGGELQWEHLRFPEPIKTTRTGLSVDGNEQVEIDAVGLGAANGEVCGTAI